MQFSIDFDTKERARRAAEGKQTSPQHLTEFILDLDTGKATQHWATDADTTGDFPVVPHSLIGIARLTCEFALLGRQQSTCVTWHC